MSDKLNDLRARIGELDNQLLPLFLQRMEIARDVAQVKIKNNLPVLNAERENEVIATALASCPPELKGELQLFFRTLMALSRGHQNSLMFGGAPALLPEPRTPVSKDIICAYQGVEGAWGEQAATTLFPSAKLQANERFEDVFLSVKEGRAHYGVVPLENSKTGAIGENYDLLRQYGCYLVGRTWISIRQCLLGLPGAALTDVRYVHSHPEGFRQCSEFLRDKSWDLLTSRNTAVAAAFVAHSGDARNAAIGSRLAAQMHGLEVLQPDIMDVADNRTSFVVIATQPEYNDSSDLISLTFSTPHHSGALCETLIPFMAENLNLSRIESRPQGGDKYRFFAEVEGNIRDKNVITALRQAASSSEYFEVLGCYHVTPTE
jgi:chorismate mutase/prephenate dehydratase